jgi:hypothetical protein
MAATDWTALDYDDPAALLAVLRPAYYKLLAGETDAEIEGTDRRRVRFQPGDAKRLEVIIRDLEARVDRANGKRRRFAASIRYS